MTTSQNRYSINGYVDTNNNVYENIEAIASAAGTWVTFDHTIGKWSIVINKAGTSTFGFDDSNIIGNISLTETNFNEMYNSVEIQFPHEELLDQTDWVRFDLPLVDRLPNEPNNRLTIQTTLLNDPVQAEQIALTELKQSRVNKMIEWQSDFSCLGITAGDIVDISNTEFGWNQKLFRIISVGEEDDADGNIVLSFTALEYDANVYDYTDLSRFARTRATGIKPKLINVEIAQEEDVATGNDLGRLLALAGLSSLLDLNNVVDAVTGENSVSIDSGSCFQPTVDTGGGNEDICNQVPISIPLTSTPKSIEGCEIPANPQYSITNYAITGVNSGDINIPLTGSITAPGSLSITGTPSSGGKTAIVAFKTATGETRSTKEISFKSGYSISVAKTLVGTNLSYSITSTAPSGTGLSWSVSGTNLSSIYTGATSGSVTVGAGGSGTLNFTLTTNATSSTATFNLSISGGNCGNATDSSSFAGTVIDPTDPANWTTVCGSTQIPLIYCPRFDPSNNLAGISVEKYAYVKVAPVGGVEVPLTVTVTGGAIVVSSTVFVDNAATSGVDLNIITSFDTPSGPSDPLITGTTETVRGWF
tara:strand:+ start:7082 stop:8851 length:1770 start_codon:yes stop_codon:yes gene_type:complete